MDVKELRINNLVVGKSDIYKRVTETDLGVIGHPEMFEGIPLTEELLLRFGFKPISSLGEVFEKYIFNREEISCNMTILLNGGQVELLIKKEWITLPFKLEFVHSLQNLYFALTCEELTLKD